MKFPNLCSVIATVMALPSPATSGRLLLLLKSVSETETSSSKREKRKSSYNVGSLVQAEVQGFFGFFSFQKYSKFSKFWFSKSARI